MNRFRVPGSGFRVNHSRTRNSEPGTRNLLVVFGISLLLLKCAGTTPERRGGRTRDALLLDIYPNPVVARHLGGNLYEFPFEVSLRETDGAELEIDGIRVEVRLRGAPIFTQVFDESELTRRGFSTTIPASGNVQYRFAPRREVASDVIFSHVSAEVVVMAETTNGRLVEGSTVVTVRR